MKVTVESTETFKVFDGRYYRIWIGKDDKGQDVALWVLGVIFRPGADTSEAEKHLRTTPMTGLEQTHFCTREDIGPVDESSE